MPPGAGARDVASTVLLGYRALESMLISTPLDARAAHRFRLAGTVYRIEELRQLLRRDEPVALLDPAGDHLEGRVVRDGARDPAAPGQAVGGGSDPLEGHRLLVRIAKLHGAVELGAGVRDAEKDEHLLADLVDGLAPRVVLPGARKPRGKLPDRVRERHGSCAGPRHRRQRGRTAYSWRGPLTPRSSTDPRES